MTRYEYKVVPAPEKPVRYTGLARGDDPFAVTLAELFNDMGRDGWAYLRTDTVTERRGVWPLRRRRVAREMFVFQRAKPEPSRAQDATPALLLTAEARVPALAPPTPAPTAIQTPAMVRARRVRRTDVVEFVRSGGRRIDPSARRTSDPHATAAE